jgi:hypothetical protein
MEIGSRRNLMTDNLGLDEGLDKGSGLVFSEKRGALWWRYRETVALSEHSSRIYSAKGVVPSSVIKKGASAVRSYAEEQAQLQVSKAKEHHSKLDKFLKNPNFPIEAEYDGLTLKGKIDSASERFLHVVLEEPYHGDVGVNFGYASAVAGHFILEGENFSNYALRTARKLLVDIYIEQKHTADHSEIIHLAEVLNKKRE